MALTALPPLSTTTTLATCHYEKNERCGTDDGATPDATLQRLSVARFVTDRRMTDSLAVLGLVALCPLGIFDAAAVGKWNRDPRLPLGVNKAT